MREYVALGDSFAAGPLIATTELETGCFRSTNNYPSLLAKSLAVATVRDVSCSAAQTSDLRSAQKTLAGRTVPPQLDALSRRTDLVTISIGGNDLDLFSRAVRGDVTAAPGLIAEVGSRVTSALRLVNLRAPGAEVVLVGYSRLVDPGSACPARLPFDEVELTAAYSLQRQLNATLKRAADEAGVHFVDLFAASEGHGVCSRQPWMNGQYSSPGNAAAYHPFIAGMRAAARAVARTLSLQR